MKDKKLQVFVSSTFTDLRSERQAAVEAILSSGNIPAGMELFSAGDESQMTVIERWIDESDVYLLILGGRYGSIDEKTGKSYTHLEFEYAISKKKPLFAVVINQNALEEKVKKDGLQMIEQKYQRELSEFRGIVLKNLVKFWDDAKDIKLAIYDTLSNLNHTQSLVGWIRRDNSINTGAVTEEIARLTKENFEVRSQLNETRNTSPLYYNLTFSELEQLLKKDISLSQGIMVNLFDQLVGYGARLVHGLEPNGEDETIMIEKMVKYGIVKEIGSLFYVLTNEGHSFYLRALLSSFKIQ